MKEMITALLDDTITVIMQTRIFVMGWRDHPEFEERAVVKMTTAMEKIKDAI